MEKNYTLAKWLNNDMTETELAAFEAHPDFEKYEKIKKHSAQLLVANFDEEGTLQRVLSHPKSSPKVVSLFQNWLFKVAAVLVVALGITFAVSHFATETHYALNGSKTSFALPDNSEVVLNAGSEIKYQKWNWKQNRKLKLDGEAYFKVAKGRKFEVTTSLGTVAVLGTQFNVKARQNRFNVTCFEGRVKVNYKNEQLLLTHGQSVTFENGKKTTSLVAVSKPEWMENRIAFEKANLRTILDEIERQYDVTIQVKAPYSEELFTGKIPTDNLDVALQIIATTYHLQATKTNANKIIFGGK